MWLQMMQWLLARVHRTEAALSLAPPLPPAPTPAVTLDGTPQQLPRAGSLLQELQELDTESDSGSECDDDRQSYSAAEPSTSMNEPACSTEQAAALHSGLGRSSEVSTSGRDMQPDAASALQSLKRVERHAQQADQGSHTSGLQAELVCRSDGFSTQRDMPAASQEQYESRSVQLDSGMADEQASGSSSVADAAAVQKPKRRFRNFFRFRPEDNNFL